MGVQPGHSQHAAVADPLPEAVALARAAADARIGLKLLGGLAVRVLCPELPARQRAGQDMDFACLSKGRKETAAFLERSGCVPDRRFNNLNGDRQMYFNAPSGRPVDVMVDRLSMCHTLDFKPSFGSASSTLPTLDPADLLLSKLQIVELNAKDAHDIFHLLSGLRVGRDSARPSIDPDRFGAVLAADWGWWRTVTRNLGKLPDLLSSQPGLAPPYPRFDAVTQAKQLQEVAETVPKGLKWKTRARVGDRVRWYELPEEVDH